MRANFLVELNNVVEAKKCVAELLTRTRKRQPGMMLIYGDSGSGKTAFAEEMAFAYKPDDPIRWTYYRVIQGDNPKSFTEGLLRNLNLTYTGSDYVPRQNLAAMEQSCIDLLNTYPNTVVEVDEVNLLTSQGRWKQIEIIRDLADLTEASFVLVGERKVRKEIYNYDKHLYNRLRWLCEFTTPSIADYKLLAQEVVEVEFDDDLVKAVHTQTKGDLRQAYKTFEMMERDAKAAGLSRLTLNDVEF